MNEKVVNININFEHNFKKRITTYKLEGLKKPLPEKNPYQLSLKYIGEKQCNIRRGTERDFPTSPVLTSKMQTSPQRKKSDFKSLSSVESIPLIGKKENSNEHKKSRSEIIDAIKSSKEKIEKIIIITDNDFFKKKNTKSLNSLLVLKNNKTDKDFFPPNPLGPLEIRNLKSSTYSNFNSFYDQDKSNIIKKNPPSAIKNVFIKERAISFHEKQNPKRYNSHFAFLKDLNLNNNINRREFPNGKKVSDYTRSNIYIEGIKSRLVYFSRKHEFSSLYNGFNEMIRIQNIKPV